MTGDAEKLYRAGYAAFERGELIQAISLANQCLTLAPVDSYWHFGALGLRCWAANFLGDSAAVERDAYNLLDEDAGDNKPWFDGLALLNLGLDRRRMGRLDEAQAYFARASKRYAAYQIGPQQPAEWGRIIQFFTVVTQYAASTASEGLAQLAGELSDQQSPSAEMKQLGRALTLYLRHANGEDVRAEAEVAAGQGISRAFLALILL